MSDQNPYAAPQAVQSVADESGNDSEQSLFADAVSGGYYCYLSVAIFGLSLILGFFLIAALGQIGKALALMGVLLAAIVFMMGLNKLRELPSVINADKAFTIALVMSIFLTLITICAGILQFYGNNEFDNVLQMIAAVTQFILIIASLYGQRKLSRYVRDNKLLSNNNMAVLAYAIMTSTAILITLFMAQQTVVNGKIQQQPSLVLFLLLVLSLAVFLINYTRAFKRISELTSEWLVHRKSEQVFLEPNQFKFLK
jgi:hypothetical protein